MRGRTASAFVGRERELEALAAGLDDAFAGRGRLFLISGEPGIGKSRLADELANRAAELGGDVLVGRCWEAGGAPAFWPWVQALRALVRGRDPDTLRSELGAGAPDLAQLLPELRDLFPDLPAPPSTDSEGARFRLFDAVASLLRDTAREQPLVVVLDDLHAADEPSLLLLRFVARGLGESPVLIAALYRDVDPALADPLATALAELTREPVTRTLQLSGLAEPEVLNFIELTAEISTAARLAAAVHAETDGNPLFVGEIVRLLAAEGRLDDTDAPRIAIPQSIKEVIGRRLRRLSHECSEQLTVAAVLGREFDLDALAGVSGLERDALLELLDEATTARIVSDVPGAVGRLRFAHTLIRDVVYEALPSPQRVQLHRQAAEALEQLHADDLGPHLAEIVHHFFEANDARVLDYARRAGDRAIALLAYEEAVRLYEMALALTRDPIARCELLLDLGEAQSRAGDTPASNQSFLEASDLADAEGLAQQLAQAALGYGGRLGWEVSRDDERVVPLLERAIERLGDSDAKLRVRLLARLAGGPLRDASFPPERRAALSEEALATARRIGDPATLVYALEGYVSGHHGPDHVRAQLELAGELIKVAREVGNRERLIHGHEMQVVSFLELGDIRGTKQALEAMAGVAGELRQPAQQWLVGIYRSLLALLEGRLPEAAELIEETFEIGQKAQSWNASASYALQLYLLRRDEGRLAEVEELIRRSAEERPTYPILRCVLANLTAELGLDSESRGLFEALTVDNFAALPFDEEWLVSMGFLTETAQLLSYKAPAGTMYELLLPYADRVGVAYPEISTGALSRYLGILASIAERWDEAVRHFEDALELNGRIGARPWVAHTQLDYARMLLLRHAPGDSDRATKLLRSTLVTCRELGMDGLTGDASTLLSELEPMDTGLKVAGYRVEGEIGRGGMGLVYRATDLELERPVALKLIAPELGADERFRERFLRESRVAASLDHGNVIPIYEAGEADGRLFLAMRYVEGEDLKSLLQRDGKLTPERAVAICGQVAAALDAAHRRGLVHRDVKPGNVLLDEEEHVYLADFGLTKQLTEGGGATRTGQLVGTLDYLAPEQIRGEELDGRTDQYALACCLYECLAGAPPFRRETEAEALWAHMQEEPPPLRDHPTLQPVLARGLAKDKEERYASCAELVQATRSALGLEAPELRKPLVPPALLRHGRALFLAGVLVLAGGVVAAVLAIVVGSGSSPLLAPPNSLAVIDPATNRVVRVVPVGDTPTSVALGAGAVWVLNANGESVSKIDSRSRTVLATFSVGTAPTDLAVGDGALWVATSSSSLLKIDPGSKTATSIRLPRSPNPLQQGSTSWVAAAGRMVWATGDATALRVAPSRLPVVFPNVYCCGGIAIGGGRVWIADGTALRGLNAETGQTVIRVPLRFAGGHVAFGRPYVWVADPRGRQVWAIDPRTGTLDGSVSVGIHPDGIAIAHRAVWVASANGTVSRIDPMSLQVVKQIKVGGTPAGIAAGNGAVWVAVD